MIFYRVFKWVGIALTLFSVYWMGRVVIDSLPRIANMYR